LHAVDVDHFECTVAVAGVQAIAVTDQSIGATSVVRASKSDESTDSADEFIGSGVKDIDSCVGTVSKVIEFPGA
jgi:hypothetical protein